MTWCIIQALLARKNLYTLTAKEISTGWTAVRALNNKAMISTRKALEDVYCLMPVPLRSCHFDNGSEFINAHLIGFCKEKRIYFTRSRPYRENGSPYVESNNWSTVRGRHTGWMRYDTDEKLKALDSLLRLITMRHNFFMPR